MTRERPGAKPLDTLMRGVIEATLARRGLSEAGLIADWPAIVGESIARYARPLELQWPPRPTKPDPDASVPPATLVLRVDGAFALEAQHNAAAIVERVNAHLGWRCIEKLAFRQGPLPTPRRKPRERPPPSPAAEDAARQAASRVDDESLREALTRFGARAIDRAARNSAREPEGE
jgi:hypothetical protein